MPELPRHLFALSAEEKIDEARKRFFESGELPVALFGQPVVQSWLRCSQEGRRPDEKLELDRVPRSRLQMALQRNHALIEAARPELQAVGEVLQRSACRAVLVDKSAVVLLATPAVLDSSAICTAAGAVGTNLGEGAVGTGSPSLPFLIGGPCTLAAGQHFFQALQHMYCAGVPIRDHKGRIVAGLSAASEGRPFSFDAVGMLLRIAASVENRLLTSHASTHVLLRFHIDPRLFHTPLEGLAGVAVDGRLAWVNESASRLLALDPEVCGRDGALEAVLGLGLAQARQMAGRPGPVLVPLPTGIMVWMTASLRATVEAGGPAPEDAVEVAAPAIAEQVPTAADAAEEPASLHDRDRQLVLEALRRFNGNVAHAARFLGVSRNLVYRRLRQADSSGAAAASAELAVPKQNTSP